MAIAPLAFFACGPSVADGRDGQNYSVTEIGGRLWMAENLNFATDGSFCPDGDERNCKKLGRLYSWAAAQNACPEGWRLPTLEDFKEITTSYTGAELKSTSGWFKKGNGNNKTRFAALPAGLKNAQDKFDGIGGYAYFWSATTDSIEQTFAYYLFLDFSSDSAKVGAFDKGDARSVRCVKD